MSWERNELLCKIRVTKGSGMVDKDTKPKKPAELSVLVHNISKAFPFTLCQVLASG